jgi:chemotaxis protein CheD
MMTLDQITEDNETQFVQNSLDLMFEHIQYVKLGEIVYTTKPERYNLLGIGTCLGIFMYDLTKCKYMLAHCMLPELLATERSDKIISIGKYTDVAIKSMLKRLLSEGCKKSDIKVKMAGGAQIFNDLMKIGSRNIEVAHRVLEEEGLKLVAEDVGGKTGRSITCFCSNGTLLLRKTGEKYSI